MNTLFSIGNLIYLGFLTKAAYLSAAGLYAIFVEPKLGLVVFCLAGFVVLLGAAIRYLFTGYFVFNTFGVPTPKPQHWETVEEDEAEHA